MPAKRKTSVTVDEIQSDLYALRDDVSNLADQVTTLLSDKGEDVVTDLKERITRIRENIDGTITGVSERGRAAVREAKESVDGFTETVEESIRERPLTMLAVALGLGVLFGRSMRR